MAKLTNRFWFQLHGYFSLPVWILFCFVCLTGTIAVISHELTWLTNPASRAVNPDNHAPKNMAEIMTIVEAEYPTAKVTTVMNFEPYLVNAVVFTDSDKPNAVAYVNQYTGEIQETNTGITFIGFMRSLHSWLLFPWQNSYSVGYYLVCVMAIVMLGALITGLIIYKNFWRSFLSPKVRKHQGQRTFLADLHRLAGVWSIWFMLLMSITGLWYLCQAILWHSDTEIEAHPPAVYAVEVPKFIESTPAIPYSLNEALEITKGTFPNFSTTYILPPEHFRDTYKIYGEGDFIFYDKYAYGASVNPWTGELTVIRRPSEMNTLQTLTHISHPLHYGTIGGIWTKIIWFLFGILLTGMSITGFLMWGKRTIHAAKNVQPVIKSKPLSMPTASKGEIS